MDGVYENLKKSAWLKKKKKKKKSRYSPSSSPILLHATNTTSFPSPSLPDLGPDPGIGVDVDVEGAVEYRGVGSCSGTSLAAQ